MLERDWPNGVKQEGEYILKMLRPQLTKVREKLLDVGSKIDPELNPKTFARLENADKNTLSSDAKEYLDFETEEATISEQIVTAKVCQYEDFTSPNFDYEKVDLYSPTAEENAVKSAIEYGLTKGIPATHSERFMREVRIIKSKKIQKDHLDALKRLNQEAKQLLREEERERQQRLGHNFPRDNTFFT